MTNSNGILQGGLCFVIPKYCLSKYYYKVDLNLHKKW